MKRWHIIAFSLFLAGIAQPLLAQDVDVEVKKLTSGNPSEQQAAMRALEGSGKVAATRLLDLIWKHSRPGASSARTADLKGDPD